METRKDPSGGFSLFLNVEWKDERLVLGEEFDTRDMISVDASFVKEAWLPNVFIYDLRSFKVTEVLNKMSGVWISRDKYVLYSQAAKMTIMCPLEFSRFPFDTQTCKLRVGSYSFNDARMKFSSKHFNNVPLSPSNHPFTVGKYLYPSALTILTILLTA